jgi:hypothetical protein
MKRLIKLAVDGTQLPPDAPEWSAVLDPTTQLVWSAADVSDRPLNQDEAAKACAELTLCGFNDWRLPERQELTSIVDLSRHSPAADPEFFPSCRNDWYWTSSPCAWSADYAWQVLFLYGDVLSVHRDSYARVRAVRSALPASQ